MSKHLPDNLLHSGGPPCVLRPAVGAAVHLGHALPTDKVTISTVGGFISSIHTGHSVTSIPGEGAEAIASEGATARLRHASNLHSR